MIHWTFSYKCVARWNTQLLAETKYYFWLKKRQVSFISLYIHDVHIKTLT